MLTKIIWFLLPGIKVKYDLAKPPQHRVVEASAICQNCTFPAYEPIDKTVMYSLILSNFILTGGDSYHVIRDNAELTHTVGKSCLFLVSISICFIYMFICIDVTLLSGGDEEAMQGEMRFIL